MYFVSKWVAPLLSQGGPIIRQAVAKSALSRDAKPEKDALSEPYVRGATCLRYSTEESLPYRIGAKAIENRKSRGAIPRRG